LACSVPGSQFEIFWEADAPERPDPYLAHLDLASFAKPDIADIAAKRANHLRVVK
jgi:urea transport system substrate-binding protein